MILTVLGFIWGVVTAVAGAVFWLLIVGMICATVAIVATRNSPARTTSTESLRAALRTGELDGEIARSINRNSARRGR